MRWPRFSRLRPGVPRSSSFEGVESEREGKTAPAFDTAPPSRGRRHLLQTRVTPLQSPFSELIASNNVWNTRGPEAFPGWVSFKWYSPFKCPADDASLLAMNRWAAQWDPTQQRYYFYNTAGQTTWNDPRGPPPPPPAAPVAPAPAGYYAPAPQQPVYYQPAPAPVQYAPAPVQYAPAPTTTTVVVQPQRSGYTSSSSTYDSSMGLGTAMLGGMMLGAMLDTPSYGYHHHHYGGGYYGGGWKGGWVVKWGRVSSHHHGVIAHTFASFPHNNPAGRAAGSNSIRHEFCDSAYVTYYSFQIDRKNRS